MDLAERIVPGLQGLAEELTAAGVPTSLERTRVNPPGAWLTAQGITSVYLDGSGTIRAHLFLIGRASQGDVATLTALSGLLQKALPVVSLADDVDNLDMSYQVALPHTPETTFPAFRLLVDIDL